MITIDNLRKVLTFLGFEEENEVYTKRFETSDCDIKVDFKNKRIVYPNNLKIHRETTTNFSEPENFVVLECIVRLLQQGYFPHQIELEKPMPGGHDDTGGYCDIIIQDNEKVPFLLLEVKKENVFNQFWNKMKLDGGQLFNYYNSYRQAQALCLYTSDFVDGKVVYTSHIVSMVDNDEYLKTAKNLKGFKDMQALNAGKSAYFDVWKNTYQLDFMTKGIFEENIQPFAIGKVKLGVGDLYEIDSASMQKKYNEFATIMRQHNISGHENAFDKLVNLFLAKIVDESENANDLKFYWKGVAQDNYYSFQDRLQQMYTKGMIEFLGEDVTYIDEETIKNSFKLFANDPDATKETILEYFRQQKFYTNNDFAFLDVHNQALFLQNIVVLIKCVQMLQDIRLKTETENQFLGDLFEGFLDQGVKQSEGQFFTPMPIVKFLVSSLPLQKMITGQPDPLKVIDYACGAGHFLNEYGHQIKPFLPTERLKDYYQEIIGIEKEYRLSKVAKVSAFMYGQNDINIIYADALAENAKIKDNTFSVLVANPPYSVKGFLETLSDSEREKFQLTKQVGDISKNNSIETFFVERAAQLLKTDGMAAIILPSSILSNGNIYSKCQRILLENFQIVAIAEFGSGTFGKTGTNTCTLFLRKRGNNPNTAQHYHNRVNSWFNGDFEKDRVFDDNHLLQKYCQHVGYNFEDYKSLLQGEPSEALLQTDLFKDYEHTFDARKKNNRIDTKELNETAKNIRTKMRSRTQSKLFIALSADEQNAEIHKKFIDFAKEIEKEKLYVFILASTNQNDVLVIKTPTDKDKTKTSNLIKQFLGYEWSDSKGNEGIKYLNVASSKKIEEGESADDDTIQQIKGINGIQTPLFNPLNLADESKLNTLIRQNFTNGCCDIPQTLEPYAQCFRLPDMLDFSRTTFDKAIKLSVDKKTEITSKWDMVRLGEIFDENPKSKIQVGEAKKNENGDFPFFTSGDNIYRFSDYLVDGENIFLSTGGNAVVKFYEGRAAYSTDTYVIKTKNADKIKTYYLYLLLENMIDDINLKYFKGTGLKHLQKPDFKQIRIPLPPLPIQQEIVTACQAIDSESQDAQNTIAAKRKEIEAVMNAVSGEMKKLGEVCEFVQRGKSPKYGNANIQVIKSGQARGYYGFDFSTKYYLDDSVKVDERKLQNGDILINSTGVGTAGRVTLFNLQGDYVADNHITICRPDVEKILSVFFLHYLADVIGFKKIESMANGASGQIELARETIKQIQIPIPSLSVQQEIVAKVTALEDEIAAAEKVVVGAAERKKKVLADRL